MMFDKNDDSIVLSFVMLFFVFFLETIWIIFRLSGTVFQVELVLFFVFLIAAIMLMMGLYSNRRWAHPLLTLFFSLNLINVLYIYSNFVVNELNFMLLTSVGVLGLVTSVINIEDTPQKKPKKAKKKKIVAKEKVDFDIKPPEKVKLQKYGVTKKKKAKKKATKKKKKKASKK